MRTIMDTWINQGGYPLVRVGEDGSLTQAPFSYRGDPGGAIGSLLGTVGITAGREALGSVGAVLVYGPNRLRGLAPVREGSCQRGQRDGRFEGHRQRDGSGLAAPALLHAPARMELGHWLRLGHGRRRGTGNGAGYALHQAQRPWRAPFWGSFGVFSSTPHTFHQFLHI